jgi:hypothetical protein
LIYFPRTNADDEVKMLWTARHPFNGSVTVGRTDFLFATPSFMGGVATAFDLGATLVEYNQSRSSQEADMRALRADWAAVCDDLVFTLSEYQGAGAGE